MSKRADIKAFAKAYGKPAKTFPAYGSSQRLDVYDTDERADIRERLRHACIAFLSFEFDFEGEQKAGKR